MSRPILVLADIHGNLPALKTVLTDAGGRAEGIWVLGDTAGYGPQPGECLDLLRRLKAHMVAGNHDWAACGKIEIEDFNPDAAAAAIIHRHILTEEQKEYLASLPERRRELSVSLSHGDPRNPIWGYVIDRSTAAAVLAEADTSLTLLGHSHLPGLWAYSPSEGAEARRFEFGREISYAGRPHLANPGSVGQSRDGDPAARYMIVDPVRKTLEFRRVKWRAGSLKRRMKKDGYPETLIARMTSGH